MATYIYGLRCPISNLIRYVGKSTSPKSRLRTHIRKAISGEYDHHNARWIRKLSETGYEPQLVILHEVQEGEDWAEIEREYIENFKRDGFDLTNSTLGGDGLSFADARYKDDVVSRMRSAAIARTRSGESRRELSARAHMAWESDAAKPAMLAGLAKGRTAEALDRRSKRLSAEWSDPEKRESMLSRFRTEEIRSKRSEMAKARWADPEFRLKMAAVYASKKEQLSRAANIRWAKGRAAKNNQLTPAA